MFTMTSVTRTTIAVGIILLASLRPAYADCGVLGFGWLQMLNSDREVFGDIDAECPWWLPPPIGHTVPFGNWGADSNGGWRIDGNDFAGWKDLEGHRQWNSCTVHEDFDPPDNRYYNANDWTSQVTEVGTYAYGNLTLGGAEMDCTSLWENQVVTIQGNFMDLYELDWNGDDFVTTLTFPDIDLTMSCANGECSAESQWYSQTSASPNVASAKIKMTLVSYYDIVPCE